MDIAARYQAYAQAFEESYDDDDFSRLEPYFTEDAVYRFAPGEDGQVQGRDAVLARLKGGVDAFDRRMDHRRLDFEGDPSVDGDTTTARWKGVYTKAGLPDLVISGVEHATFVGDRIAVLADDFDPEAQKGLEEWMQAHGAKLA